MKRYSEQRKNAVLQKILDPEGVSIAALSLEEGISRWTLYDWRKQSLGGEPPLPDKGRRSDTLSAEAKFAIVVETATLPEAELSQYCRERGLYPEHIKTWKQAFIEGIAPGGRSPLADRTALQNERKRSKSLERELNRKEKALAEAAALLVLRKKAKAIWGEDEDE